MARTVKNITHYIEPDGKETKTDRTAIIQAMQVKLGAKLDGVFKPDGDPGPLMFSKFTAALLRLEELERQLERIDTIPVASNEIEIEVELPADQPSQPPTVRDGSGQHSVALTLGQRALEWCLSEAERWHGRKVDVPTIRSYLAGCVREGTPNFGPWLAKSFDPNDPDKRHAHCAAAQGFAELNAAGPFRNLLPPHRSAVHEVLADAKAGRRPNERFAPIDEFYDATRNLFIKAPPPGSLVFYIHRTKPGRGHLERLIEANAKGLRSVGANEQDMHWIVDAEPIPWTRLEKADGVQSLYIVGFGVPLEVRA